MISETQPYRRRFPISTKPAWRALSYLLTSRPILALICGALLLALNYISPTASIMGALALFIAGFPHGAIEYQYIRNTGHRIAHQPSLSYCTIYVIAGLICAAFMLTAPLIGLGIFLLLSAIHFSWEDAHFKSIGFLVIAGSCLTYPAETIQAFSVMVGIDLSTYINFNIIKFIGAVAIFAFAGEAIWRRRANAKVISLVVIFLILPPVQAVAVYFFCFHAIEAVDRDITLRREAGNLRSRPTTISSKFNIYIWTSAVSVISATIICFVVMANPQWLPIAAALAIGFAVPHMFNAFLET